MKILDTVRSTLTQPKVVRPVTTLALMVGLAAIGAGTAALMGRLDLSQASAIGTTIGGGALFAASAVATARRRKTTVRIVTCDLEHKEETDNNRKLFFNTSFTNPFSSLAHADVLLFQKTGTCFSSDVLKQSFPGYEICGYTADQKVMWKKSRFTNDFALSIGPHTSHIDLFERSSRHSFHIGSSALTGELLAKEQPYEPVYKEFDSSPRDVQIIGTTHSSTEKVATHKNYKVITSGESHIAWRSARTKVTVEAKEVSYSRQFSNRPPLIVDFTLTSSWLTTLFGR